MAVPGTPTTATSPSAATAQPRPRLAAQDEHRFAVVLYGGTSLAVYISGVARELLELVRATAPHDLDRPWHTTALHDDGALAGTTAALYRDAARSIARRESDGADAPIRTRFVVDILSGTSAGGLNGVFLARALVTGGTLDHLRDVWLSDGAIERLVNDADSIADLEGLKLDDPIVSVLNGGRMYRRLHDSLELVHPAGGPPGAPLVERLDLYVTATDLQGVVLPIRLADRRVHERRHRKVFHFTHPPDDEGGDDFAASALPQLATAARSTSAFPVAFAPMTLGAAGPPADAVAAWRDRWYPEYGREVFEQRAFSDGGILDNKPFSYATHALGSRTAGLPVHRRLLYVEPQPSGLTADDGVQTYGPAAVAGAALTSIPRAETIREDIAWVEERNQLLRRARDVLANVEDDIAWDVYAEQPDIDTATWRTMLATEAADDYGIGYHAYHRLRRGTTLDYLAGVVSRARGLDADSDRRWAVRRVIAAWYDRELRRSAETPRTVPTTTGQRSVIPDRGFLATFDLAFRLRRIDFTLRRAHELAARGDARTLQLVPGLAEADDAGQEAVAAELAILRDGLREAAGHLRSCETALGQAIRERLPELRLDDAALDAVIDDPAVDDVAARVVAERAAAFDALAGAWREAISGAARESREQAMRAFARQGGPDLAVAVRDHLRRVFRSFEAYDLLTLPLYWGTPTGEGSEVDVLRVSPRDAVTLRDRMAGRREARLAGTTLNNFGGFLQRSWRRHDFAWGRLDAAERLLTTLMPAGPERDRLLDEARERIIRDEFAPPASPEPGDGPFLDPAAGGSAVEWFTTAYALPPLNPETGVKVLRRTTIVLRNLARAQVDRLEGAPRQVGRFGFWLANLLFARRRMLLILALVGVAAVITGLAIHWSWLVLLGLELAAVAGSIFGAGWWLSRRIRGWLQHKTTMDP